MSYDLPAPVRQMMQVADALCEPMFIMFVDPEGDLRYAALNRAHETQTGMRRGDVAGKTPHEALPPRLADTVLSNYERCRSTASRFAYEEKLELPKGAQWWRTTLSPLFDPEADDPKRVVGVCGNCLDITTLRDELQQQAEANALLRRQGERAKNAFMSLADELRGDLAMGISLIDVLREELRPPLDRKLAYLKMMRDTASRALDTIDDVEACANEYRSVQQASRVDMGHVLRDQLALIDPEGGMDVSYAHAMVRTDATMLLSVLEPLFGLIETVAAHRLRITLEPNPMDLGSFRIGFEVAVPSGSPAIATRRAWGDVYRLVRAHGGSMTVNEWPDSAQSQVDLSLPGMLELAGARPRPEKVPGAPPRRRRDARPLNPPTD